MGTGIVTSICWSPAGRSSGKIDWWKSAVLGGDGQREGAGLGDAQVEAHLRLLAGHIGRHAHVFDVAFRSGLQPDRAPDTAAVGVPTRHLLADHGAGVGHIVGAHDDVGGFARLDKTREVNREGQVAVVVLAGKDAVDPDTRLPVDRFEVEENPFACPLARHKDLSLVPGCTFVVGAFDAGQLALPREGHVDRQVLGPAPPRRSVEVDDLTGRGQVPAHLLADEIRVEGKVPWTVEALPIGALKIGSRVFGT